jgi:hypothetical protein
MFRTSLLVTLALLIPAIPAWSGEGRIPVYGATVITEPGHYLVTRDITVNGTVVEIQVDGVTLDLGGHTLTSTSTFRDNIFIIAAAGGPRGVTVRNGRVSGGFAGVYVDTSLDPKVVLESLEIESSGDNGIYVRSPGHARITGCRVSGAALSGIYMQGVSGAFEAVVEDNIVENVGSNGIELQGLRSGTVRGNVVTGFGSSASGRAGINLGGSSGWDAGGNIIESNTIRGGGDAGYGIFIGVYNDNNLVIGNQATRSSANGIRLLSNGNKVSSNVFALNVTQGVYVGAARNLIEANQIDGNSGCGLQFSTSGNHAYRDNMIRGNGGGSVCNPGFATDGGGNIL